MQNHAYILKHPLRVRMFHYLLVLSFIPLAATGAFLFLKPFEGETMNLLMRIHVTAGVILTLDVAAFFVLALDRVVLFTKRAFTFGLNDVQWFAVLGGYPQKFLLHKKVPVPPMGKYNSGQKLFGACILVGGIILILTGWALWVFPHVIPHGVTQALGVMHLLVGGFLTLFLLVHIFLGIYMFDDFKAMFLHGRIAYEEAKEVAPLWVQNDIVSISKQA